MTHFGARITDMLLPLRWAGMIALMLVFTPFTATAGPRDMKVSPNLIDVMNGESTDVTFFAETNGQAILQIYGPDWRKVYETSLEGISADTLVSIPWDGRDAEGQPLPAEAYFPVLEFFSDQGVVTTIDRSTERALGQVLVQNITYDADAGGVRFSLKIPARVTLLAGIDGGGPLMKTLLSGVPYPAGDHLLEWDGMDQSAVVNLAEEDRFRIFASAREIWPISVILRNAAAPGYHTFSERFEDQELPIKDGPNIDQFGGAPHMLPRPEDISPEPVFHLSVAGYEGEDIPIVTGQVPLVVSLMDDVKIPVLARRFEIVLFHNYDFTTEVEEGRSPATIVWNAEKLPPGRYIVTVNVATLPGQMSAASMIVDLE